jgi:hypothetical protein
MGNDRFKELQKFSWCHHHKMDSSDYFFVERKFEDNNLVHEAIISIIDLVTFFCEEAENSNQKVKEKAGSGIEKVRKIYGQVN